MPLLDVLRDTVRSVVRREPVPGPVAAAAGAVVLTVVLVTGALLVTGSPSTPDEREASSDPLVVITTTGAVRGVEDREVRRWRGLPYAAAPVGALRWRAPRPATPWTDVRDATEFGASCLQPTAYTYGAERLRALPGSSEDCLYLNVTRPVGGSEPLPVVVWLHGGGLLKGSGSTVDPSVLAGRGTVVVTINHRLGRLGYFAHPALEQDVANLGLLDQVAALEWVRDNAASFGGDPDQVTVMGGSAGAMSVNALMVAPAAEGLFDRAIAQSAPGDAGARTLADLRRQGARDFPSLSARELRALPATDLLSSTFNVLLGDAPVVDAVLPETVAEAFAAGREAAVPYLVGTTDAEFSDDDYRAAGSDPRVTRAGLGGPDHDALVRAYGPAAFRRHVLDDLVFQAPAVALALQHAERAPTYRYRFGVDAGGSGHGAEVPYVFGTEERPERRAVASAMVDHWAAFVRTGDPGVAGREPWPSAAGTAYLDVGARGPRAVARDPWTDRLAALNAVEPLRLPVGPTATAARGR